MYEDMINNIDFVVKQGNVPQEFKQQQAFSKWTPQMTSGNHDAIIQVSFLFFISHFLIDSVQYQIFFGELTLIVIILFVI